jgi:hypothetical protein
MSQTHRLAAIVAADVGGYSRLPARLVFGGVRTTPRSRDELAPLFTRLQLNRSERRNLEAFDAASPELPSMSAADYGDSLRDLAAHHRDVLLSSKLSS